MIEIRGMRPGELSRVHKLLKKAFPHTPAGFFDRQAKHDPALKPEHTRLLFEEGRLLSCVRVFFRTVRCGDTPLLMGGIGDVGTDPDHQGRGLNSRLMEDTLRYLKESGAVFYFLFTRINPYCQKFGYFTLPTCQVTIPPPSRARSVAWRRADLSRDLPALDEIYTEATRDRMAPVIRDRRYWTMQHHLPRLDPDLFWVHEKKGVPEAYIRGRVQDGRLKILEFGCRKGKDALIRRQ